MVSSFTFKTKFTHQNKTRNWVKYFLEISLTANSSSSELNITHNIMQHCILLYHNIEYSTHYAMHMHSLVK